MIKDKIVIIGASHPGHEAAIELADRYQDLDITVFEASDFVSFMSCGMKLFLEGKTTGQDNVRNFSPDELTNRGIKLQNNSEAVAINPESKTVTIKNTLTNTTTDVNYDKLILTPGVKPQNIPVPGNNLDHIYLMRGYDWASKINEALNDPEIKHVTVIGAGNGVSAVEAALSHDKQVTLIDNNDAPLANYLPEEFTAVFSKELTDKKVNLVMGATVTGFKGDNTVEAVITDKGEVATDLVIVTVGIKANTSWLKDTVKLNKAGYISTDEYFRTNLPDVYALGDAIWPYSIPAGKNIPIPSASASRHEAQYLVNHLFEQKPSQPFHGLAGAQLLEFGNVHAVVTGLNSRTAKFAGIEADTAVYVDHLRPNFIPDEDNPMGYVALTFDKFSHQILGGAVMSSYDLTGQGNVLSLAISHKLTLEDLAEQDFFFSPSFDRQWSLLNLAAQHALGWAKF
ncbi:FAD-dependent oxidoreductase [Lactobacillus gigeriorum]|uniref:NADH peroxidase n=1 Tax=Lactobacillus gigeriorum DSM 23908 = CRBIP 24.85 TaxID=1423751 RepID=I7KNG4_9LACO|nr:FAD-dependent oxidoreductase [Lactobacillus gigeriorum]KRN09489.1 NADH peroxidase [Lactobacillus gigeriorum DSM 23908 = CRBIP 24.85]CCI86714.1 NADH peroxidase [Lactobacillus gigeriorum DSM 23908 = CRBIP 24.85]